MDRVSASARSRMMSRIRGKDTQPELVVRKYLHAAGLRYRLHVSTLPGKPDIVLVRRRICVFVHGCFWHSCSKCADGRHIPISNRSYWESKLQRNKLRDRLHLRNLRDARWKVLIIWECEISNIHYLEKLRREILKRHVT